MKQLLILLILISTSWGKLAIRPRFQAAVGFNHHPGVQALFKAGPIFKSGDLKNTVLNGDRPKPVDFSFKQFKFTPTIGYQYLSDFKGYNSIGMTGGQIELVDIPNHGFSLVLSGDYLYDLESPHHEGWRSSFAVALLYFTGVEVAFQHLEIGTLEVNFFFDFGSATFGW